MKSRWQLGCNWINWLHSCSQRLLQIDIDGEIVIGEGEIYEAPMLYIGELEQLTT